MIDKTKFNSLLLTIILVISFIVVTIGCKKDDKKETILLPQKQIIFQDDFNQKGNWKFDFENIYNLPSFKEEIKKSLKNSILNNEKRLVNINIDLQIEQVEVPVKFKNKRVKIRILFVVTGIIEKTNEKFSHQDKFYIGPLSYS